MLDLTEGILSEFAERAPSALDAMPRTGMHVTTHSIAKAATEAARRAQLVALGRCENCRAHELATRRLCRRCRDDYNAKRRIRRAAGARH